jgi:hypothetical protein
MDLVLSNAARALEQGDVLAALRVVALRRDAAALALRGVAMAQLGELKRAQTLLRRAREAFGASQPLERARVLLAETEVALALRELPVPARALVAAGETLRAHGDQANAAFALVLEAQRLVLSGKPLEAEARLAELEFGRAAPATVARGELLKVELASRRIDTRRALSALARARKAAERARIPALSREVEAAAAALARPVARRIAHGHEEPLVLGEVERLLASGSLVVNALARSVGDGSGTVALARRPVLFALARALAEGCPHDVSREELIARAFGAKKLNESHRARLRVELTRLRRCLAGFAEIAATARGFVLRPRRAAQVLVLAPPVEGEHGAVTALLSDGQAWSSSAVALALGIKQRTVQRLLLALEGAGKVRSQGRARARRWLAPAISGFAPTLLLAAPLSGA